MFQRSHSKAQQFSLHFKGEENAGKANVLQEETLKSSNAISRCVKLLKLGLSGGTALESRQ
jgi:hypothetical protein